MMRRLSFLLLTVVLLLLMPACRQDEKTAANTPTPGTAPERPAATAPAATPPAATPGAAATVSLQTYTWSDPLNDCTAGLRAADCVNGREFESVSATVGDTSITFVLTLADGSWFGEQSHLTFLLFDLDKDITTGDTDYAMQYGLSPEVSLVVSWQNQKLSLNTYRGNDVTPLPLTNLELLDERSLRVLLPLRIVGSANFNFATFILGTDAVRDDFPNDAVIAFPGGEVVPRE